MELTAIRQCCHIFRPGLVRATFAKSWTILRASMADQVAFLSLQCGLSPHHADQKLPSFTFFMKLSYSLPHRFFASGAHPFTHTHEF
jgi:hypothetical protein